MLQWSQTVYGVAHSLNIAKAVKLGNLDTLLESLTEADAWNDSDLGFTSNLPQKDFRDGAIKLDGRDHEEVFVNLSENIVRILFVNLAVLADECLDYLIWHAGVSPPNYLTGKAEWVKSKMDAKFLWAANGLLEICALRNAIVHANGVLNSPAIEILEKAGISDARAGHLVSLSFGDLFRYRRALRTVLGEMEKLAAP
jgi:hypothetical protein